MRKVFLILMACLCFMSSAFAASTTEVARFSAADLNGNIISNSIFGRANLTMLTVWTTDGNPCLEQLPVLKALSQEYKAIGLQVVGIIADTADHNGSPSTAAMMTAKDLVRQHKLSFTNIIPSSSLNAGLLSKVYTVPSTYFINKNGEILGSLYLGGKEKMEWQKIIEGYLIK